MQYCSITYNIFSSAHTKLIKIEDSWKSSTCFHLHIQRLTHLVKLWLSVLVDIALASRNELVGAHCIPRCMGRSESDDYNPVLVLTGRRLARVHFDCYTRDDRRHCLPVGPADFDLTDCFSSLHGLARDLHRLRCDFDVRHVPALVRLVGRFVAHSPDVEFSARYSSVASKCLIFSSLALSLDCCLACALRST